MKDGGPVKIPLLRGGCALVSKEDAGRVLSVTWRIGSNGYVYNRKRTGQKHSLLHRFVMDAQAGEEIHHDNENPLDCQRTNLEKSSPSEHQKKYHASKLAERNRARRIYPLERICNGCGTLFEVNPNHRGRNLFCTRACGNKNRPNPGRNKKSK